ncbi:MAG: UvrD-helicase domain-containing protein [Oscillospiraceae bacterium]|nr:UvrD-helicase domain-containing protein [Oscillospiraceae bacterium]
MAEQWTPSQRRAIEARGGTVLVNAAAGSGKTSVLVERIVSLITDREHPMPADRFLAVTFTNAAANGLAARLREALEKRITQAPDDRWLRRQNLLLRRASVSTVHAFCAQLLREHAGALGIPLDFTVCDMLEAESLREGALAHTLGELYADESSGLREFSDLFGRSRSDAQTADLILELYEFECDLAFPERWQAECVAELRGVPFADSKAGLFLFDYAAQALASARKLCVAGLAACDGDKVLARAYAPAFRSDLEAVNGFAALCAEKRTDDLMRALGAYAPLRLGGSKGADEAARDRAKGLRAAAQNVLGDLRKKCFFQTAAQCDADRDSTRRALETLFSATAVFRERLFADKLKKRCFEFDDLERLTLRLLCDGDGAPTPLAGEIAARFDHILVDEYQDTNEVQDLIFRLVSRGEKNLFFVGDVKQSIYSFRGADPEIFLRRRAGCYPVQAGLYPMRIDLAENFRSSRAVIEAVNGIFSGVMSAGAGGTDYVEGEALRPFEGSADSEKTGLELLLCGDEAAALAADIRARLDAGYPIDGDGGTRPCRPGDFCILLRAPRGRAAADAAALEAQGISAWTDSEDDFFANSEIAVLLSLLHIVSNPRRDVDLCAVLLSPLFGFTPDELLAGRAGAPELPFCTALLRSQDEKVRGFLARLGELRAQSARMGVGDLTAFAADALNAEVLLCAGGEFARRRANVRLFIDYARGFEAGADASLESFLAVCDHAAKSGKSPVSESFSPPADAVCVISVHRAKGLEWPVVFLADADKRFNLTDIGKSGALFDASLGAGFRFKTEDAASGAFYSRTTAAYRALSLHTRQRIVGEEMRVLYVALTRAKQQLVVSATAADPEKLLGSLRPIADFETIDPFLVLSCKEGLSWLFMALLQRYGEALTFGPGAPWRQGPYWARVAEAAQAAAVAPEAVQTQADPAALAALARRASFRYAKEALTRLPAKLTVSALAKDAAGAPLYRPSYARGGLTGAEKGSALHLFMQLADYKAAAADAGAELARLVGGEYISAEDAAGIRLSDVRAFFGSPLGRLVLEAKTVLREYAFLDALPASSVDPDAPADAVVMIQGIADCIALGDGGAVLIDYKSDRVEDAAELVRRYERQLALYARTLSRRLPVPVRRVVLYSFHLGRAIDLPAPPDGAEQAQAPAR